MLTKKLISVILAITCVIGAFCFTASADDADFNADLDVMVNSYLFYFNFLNGEFSEGSAPGADAIDHFLKWDVELLFGDYVVEEDEYGFCKFEVPADLYEELVFSYFEKTDAMVEKLHSSDIYKTDKDEPYYFIEIGGGFGGPMPEYAHQGYTEREDGVLVAWGYLYEIYTEVYDEELGYWDTVAYVPAEGEVEGVDYIYVANENYEYDEETDTYVDTFGYVPAKLVGALQSAYTYDGEYLRYLAYEKAEISEMPAKEDMRVPEETFDYAYIGGAEMEILPGTFDRDTVVYGEFFMEGEEFDAAAVALADADGELLSVHDFYALKDGETVQPGEPVTVTFLVPEGYSLGSVSVWYVADDGSVEEIPVIATDDFFFTVTVQLEHFSYYAVTAMPSVYGDVNSDGKVSLTDVSLLLRYLADWEVEADVSVADVNVDGKVNLSDVTVMLQYLADWDVVLGPVPEEPVDWVSVYGDALLSAAAGESDVISADGLFTFGYINIDDVPELAIFDENGNFVLYTIDENGEIVLLDVACGADAPVTFNYNEFLYAEGAGGILCVNEAGDEIRIFGDGTDFGCDMYLSAYVAIRDGKYFMCEYDPEQIVSGGAGYVEGVELTELSAEDAEIVMAMIDGMVEEGFFAPFYPELIFEMKEEVIKEVLGIGDAE